MILLRETFRRGRVYTHSCLFTEIFFKVCFYTLIRLHSAFAHTFFYAEIPLHASTFTQRHFDTQWQARLHANTLTRRCLFCARFLLHALMLLCVTGMLLITHAFTQRYFYTETPLHRDAFAQGCFHTQK